MTQTHIWWIRRDIRLFDNQALGAALQGADRLVPLFIIEPELMANAAPARRRFLLQALGDLDQALQTLGSRLIVRNGPAVQALQNIKNEMGQTQVFTQEDFTPFARNRDKSAAEIVNLTLCPGTMLRHPTEITKSDDDAYSVYTPYKNSYYTQPMPKPADCLPMPDQLPPLPEGMTSDELPQTDPLPGFPATAREAHLRLQTFIAEGIYAYQQHRDRLDLEGTSKLSPYLRFGLLSIREAFAQAQLAILQAGDSHQRGEAQTWMDELVWREFYTMILFHQPQVLNGPYRPEYQHINWRDAPDDLQAWQAGQTGYPVVDACMRQLAQTGWMHNRGRMITASFLTKDLLINWQEGESWFMHNLIDSDPAANNGGWQWSAGTGTDAAPYFRIFNSVIQGGKFDPDGDFIAQWVPELARLPVKYRHEPWTLTPEIAKKHGFKPGVDYPEPIVDYAFARQRTLDAYRAARDKAE